MRTSRSVSCVALLALLPSCSGAVVTVDRGALADRIDETTDFDAEQSACIADEAFRLFDDKTIKNLYEHGVEQLRFSFEGQTYVEVVIACATR